MLHEMLAGEPPFAGSRQVVLHGVLHEPPPALAARRPDVPPAVAAAVRRALEKRPEARWPGATAFAAALGPLNGVGWGGPDEAGAALASAGAPAAPRGAAAGRTVAVRAVMYAALAGIGLGVPAGWMLARSALATRWANRTSVFLTPTTAGADGAPGVLVPASPAGGASDAALVLVDRAGRPVRALAAERPWTPRFSPDGRRVAYGAFGPGRGTSDLWVTDFEAGTTRRLTDDDADANDPQWSPDGTVLAYSVGAPGGKDLAAWPLNGGAPRVLAVRAGIQFASDWLPDGRALLVTQDAGDAQQQRDIFVQPTDGSAARPYAVTTADETAARVSPDGRWVAYTSDASGRPEVYLDAYPRPGRRVRVSSGGGVHPVWRRDGRELYYWRDDALVAVSLGAAGGEEPPAVTARTDLFRAPYEGGLNTMYDASPDGARFVVVRRR
jgi:dipeptidyl aminopeptidase/acylaminoacyl peptidase